MGTVLTDSELEEIERGEIDRLMIFMPPWGSCKTSGR